MKYIHLCNKAEIEMLDTQEQFRKRIEALPRYILLGYFTGQLLIKVYR